MIRILAIFAIDRSRAETVGLYEKAVGLIEAAKRQGFAVDAYFPDGRQLHEYSSGEAFIARSRGWSAALFRYRGFWRKLKQNSSKQYDYVWLRALPPSEAQVDFLKTMRARGSIIVLDIPTYPFDQEAKGLIRKWLFHNERRNKAQLAQIDRIVTLSEHIEIGGRPTIQVRNGVSLHSRVVETEPKSGRFKLLGIAQWADWHGLDRLLRGIAQAENSAAFEIRLAGQGPANQSLSQLATDLKLKVQWLGPVFGAEREQLLGWADAGIGCLAIHRKGVYPDQALKHRQYAAAGLPFITSRSDPSWEDVQGVMRIPADESLVDAQELSRFIEYNRRCPKEVQTALQKAAAELTWDHTYAPLWNYFHTQNR